MNTYCTSIDIWSCSCWELGNEDNCSAHFLKDRNVFPSWTNGAGWKDTPQHITADHDSRALLELSKDGLPPLGLR